MAGWCRCTPLVNVGIGTVLILICLAFAITGLAVPNWGQYEVGGTDYNFGLWQSCINGSCDSLPDSLESSKTKAAQAFLIMGTVSSLVAFVSGVYCLVKVTGALLWPALIASLAATATMLIGFITAVFYTKDTTEKFGLCYGITMAGLIQAFNAVIQFGIAKCNQNMIGVGKCQ